MLRNKSACVEHRTLSELQQELNSKQALPSGPPKQRPTVFSIFVAVMARSGVAVGNFGSKSGCTYLIIFLVALTNSIRLAPNTVHLAEDSMQ